MTFKLTKQEEASRGLIIDGLKLRAMAVSTAVAVANEAMQEVMQKVNDAVDTYNEALNEARQFQEDLIARLEEEVEDKSERWQESERAQAVSGWIADWTNLGLDDVEYYVWEQLEDFDPDHSDHLDEMNSQAES